jgi:predicted membrane channel-forming protein YqfA (hemolysin III family)
VFACELLSFFAGAWMGTACYQNCRAWQGVMMSVFAAAFFSAMSVHVMYGVVGRGNGVVFWNAFTY